MDTTGHETGTYKITETETILKNALNLNLYPSQELFSLHTYPNSRVEEVVCIKWR